MANVKLEEWHDISGFEENYQISNHGNIRSKDRWIKINGLVFFKGRLLNPCRNRYGYPHIVLTNSSKVRKTALIHSLVAESFIGPRQSEMQVNHIDGNKTNNCVDNLEYVTCAQNIRHAIDIGLKIIPVRSKRSTLSDETVREIRQLSASGKRQFEIIKTLGVPRNIVNAVVSGKRYAYVI